MITCGASGFRQTKSWGRVQDRTDRIVPPCHWRTQICDIRNTYNTMLCISGDILEDSSGSTARLDPIYVVAGWWLNYLMGLVPRYLDSVLKFVGETQSTNQTSS